MLRGVIGLAGLQYVAACFPGFCKHGMRDGGLLDECICMPFWDGDCCDQPRCVSIERDLAHNVDLNEWVRATWYVQEQQITGYQPSDTLYCVAATYNFEDKQVPKIWPFAAPYWDGTVITVYNYANKYLVNGPLQNEVNATLCARVQDLDVPSKLSVAPCQLPNYFAGPYWILAVGRNEDDGRYEWAIVIAGEPTDPYEDGCTTSQKGTNNAGLWLLSRTPVASNETLSAMRNELQAAGVTPRQLRKVEQRGCHYSGAFIKE